MRFIHKSSTSVMKTRLSNGYSHLQMYILLGCPVTQCPIFTVHIFTFLLLRRKFLWSQIVILIGKKKWPKPSHMTVCLSSRNTLCTFSTPLGQQGCLRYWLLFGYPPRQQISIAANLCDYGTKILQIVAWWVDTVFLFLQ